MWTIIRCKKKKKKSIKYVKWQEFNHLKHKTFCISEYSLSNRSIAASLQTDQRYFSAVFGCLGLRLDSHRTRDTCASQSTVSIGVFAQVLLMVVLSIVELLGLSNFCGDGTVTCLCQYLKDRGEKRKEKNHKLLDRSL